jgi:phosphatidylglycerol:prolipoprotein diacylglycerol transferase
MLTFIALYAILRFVLEYWRADDRGELLTLSTSQLLAIPALLLVATLYPRWKRR